MYSQNKEEQHILEYFKDRPVGKFIDIGAYDAFKFSNTRALYEKGWSGILVEPSPENFRGLHDLYLHEQRIELFNFAIGTENAEINFHVCEDAVSTSDTAHRDKWAAAGVPYQTIKIPQVSAEEFLYRYYRDVNFISIDTEATNMNIFRVIPDAIFEQIDLFCIEHDGCSQEVIDRLHYFGFAELYFNAENILLGKNEADNTL
jgi:FkbM family methyltransferase